MEKGVNKLCIYLYQEHHAKLKDLSKRTGQSISSVIRNLITNSVLHEMPSADFHSMTAELHAIGVNLNQIARVANATGNPDAAAYRVDADALAECLHAVRMAVLTR